MIFGRKTVSTRFLHPSGQKNVRAEFDKAMSIKNGTLRAANCFFTRAGKQILDRHLKALRRDDGFYIASVMFPTNIDALAELSEEAPGHIYIHLGGAVPREPVVGRALMHSKVFLCEDESQATLWVGSHNLTAMAFQGGNYEAAMIAEGPRGDAVFQDAKQHLMQCKATAELFNLKDLDRYKEIQRGWSKESDWDTEKNVVVVHAEGDASQLSGRFILHVNLEPTRLDHFFRLDRGFRLFVHPTDSLELGKPADMSKAKLWEGSITALVRTERHPRNQGTSGSFEKADVQIDITNLDRIPHLVEATGVSQDARTQVIVRIDHQGKVGEELFSLEDQSPIDKSLVCEEERSLDQVDNDLKTYFEEGSIKDGRLVYRQAKNVGDTVRVVGFAETHFYNDNAIQDSLLKGSAAQVKFETRESSYKIQPFFFLGKYSVRRRR